MLIRVLLYWKAVPIPLMCPTFHTLLLLHLIRVSHNRQLAEQRIWCILECPSFCWKKHTFALFVNIKVPSFTYKNSSNSLQNSSRNSASCNLHCFHKIFHFDVQKRQKWWCITMCVFGKPQWNQHWKSMHHFHLGWLDSFQIFHRK